MKKKLLIFKNKKITVEQLMKMAGYMDYDDFANIINEYVAEKILEPVKNSKKNGRRPVLYNKYRIIKQENDYSSALEDIKMLHPRFNHSKYAKQPEMYVKYKNEIDLLSKFLWENEELLKTPASINERSFQIWGKEKLIKESGIVKNIFNYNNLDLSLLNYYETPEPFFEYIYSNEKQMNILIIENKDTWYTLRKIMREDNLSYLFRNYHVLLYGEGDKIIRKTGRLKEYNDLFEESNNNYYYFGDLDYVGIGIYQTLVKNNKELNINLCTELYSWMLQESKNCNLPETKKGQKKINIDQFLKNFVKSTSVQSNEKITEILNILDSGLYIPQEIINYSLLKLQMSATPAILPQ